mgnify:CR=1 FL=1
MEQFTEYVNLVTSLGTIVLQIASVGLVIALLTKRYSKSDEPNNSSHKIIYFVSSRSILIVFLTALSSTIVSLVYSDVIGYEPCKLCWIQRIFLYPQVVIFGLALWKKTKDSDVYCFFLSVIILGR